MTKVPPALVRSFQEQNTTYWKGFLLGFVKIAVKKLPSHSQWQQNTDKLKKALLRNANRFYPIFPFLNNPCIHSGHHITNAISVCLKIHRTLYSYFDTIKRCTHTVLTTLHRVQMENGDSPSVKIRKKLDGIPALREVRTHPVHHFFLVPERYASEHHLSWQIV